MERSMEELIQGLKSADELEVLDVSGLLEINAEQSVDLLIDSLNDEDKNIRLNSAKILGYIHDPKAINPLIDTLRDNNKLVRREASTALSNMGEAALEPLIKILDDPDWKVRGAAAWALGNIKDEKAVPYLEKLLDDESGFVKTGANNAINHIKTAAKS
ncbi:HEAT repeat domain-containing protein [Methanobrevibacter sp. DSM 116169]|uniref:HEAT repeat domain-containing protein n=1 Tax=Methanobrevibacter sp. DSM 116169 TaxID=3242727 RepID=UPI0038FBFBC8